MQLDLSFFDTYELRHFELGVYPLTAKIASRQDLARLRETPPHRHIGRFQWAKLRRHQQSVHFHVESSPYFDPGLNKLPLPLHIEGYWQSEKYFLDCRRILLAELSPKLPLEPENAAIANKISSTDSISLHVRRGDYASNEVVNRVHGIVPLDYYRRAVSLLEARLANPHIFVFSDDHEWVQENLHFSAPMTFVKTNNSDRGFRDIQLQSMCRHHITANSSFSWWGAWLNPRRDKVVIAPTHWLADAAGDDSRDRVPESWLRM
ncbi:alpha-1,2-fucosyltransferase [Variovorax sp. J22R24]|uniref:alpha-1,2-fucosyltransferase n=1 Tax=Variovorax gracilis TaxID=3053502 RepID=UPI0025790503|nr:alpha-1,2-fucosyltransferase [Variovorax sp. J22R24]MDM0104001.1 alpha-1,2-fucosyltransferase [Variovorax sp. J22R24]